MYYGLFADNNPRLLVSTIGLVVGFVVLTAGWKASRPFVRQRVRGFTDDQEIPIGLITSVEPKQDGWVTGPGFGIRYEEHGEERERYVSVLSKPPLADEEFEQAKALLLDEYDLPFVGSEDESRYPSERELL